MGTTNYKTAQIKFTIERNTSPQYKELFDFTKERVINIISKPSYPFYIHHYQRTNQVSYSLMEDKQNCICQINIANQGQEYLKIVKSNRKKNCKFWKLVREDELEQIKEGDFIKLGRIQLQIKELKLFHPKTSIKELKEHIRIQPQMDVSRSIDVSQPGQSLFGSFLNDNSRLNHNQFGLNSSRALQASRYTALSTDKICRICFDGRSTNSNPLLSVCKCSGSVKYTHFSCLQSWVMRKMGRVQTNDCIYYHYQPIICQVCKQTIPSELNLQGRKYNLIWAEQIHPPYIRMQHYGDNKTFQIIVRLKESMNYVIGRGPESDININDSSISRLHCSLFYQSRHLYLKGFASKYGTCKQLTQPQIIAQSKSLQLLIYNHLLSIQNIKNDMNLFHQNCCVREQTIQLIIQ